MTYEIVEKISNALENGDNEAALNLARTALSERITEREVSAEEVHGDDPLTALALDDAKHWVDKAIEYVKAYGREPALAEFTNPAGLFVKKGMYIFALDTTGQMVAHGANEEYVGKDFYRVQDIDGRYFIKSIVDTANSTGYGWADYTWYNPATGRAEPKMTYFEKTDGMIVCCGIYLPW